MDFYMIDTEHGVYDVEGAERASLTVEDLMEKFKAGAGRRLDNDRILLSN